MTTPENGFSQEVIAIYLENKVGVRFPTDLGSLNLVRDQGVIIEDSNIGSASPLHAIQLVQRPLGREGFNPIDVILFSVTPKGQLVGARYSDTGNYGRVLQALSVSGHDDWFPEPIGPMSRSTASSPLQQYFQSIAEYKNGERVDPRISREVTPLEPHIMGVTNHSKLLTFSLTPQLDVLAMADWPATRETPTGLPVRMVASLNGYQQGLVTVEHWNSGELVRVFSRNFSLEVPAVLPQVPPNLSQLF